MACDAKIDVTLADEGGNVRSREEDTECFEQEVN